ncbi:MAG: nitrile hydratase subunit alpha [Chloroflexi bacterium]|nr:nitrile hydratase subunit alpha [Chloroflexota bacterium]
MSSDHHDHDHDHDHEGMLEDQELSYRAKRSLAIQELLIDKGLMTRESIQHKMDIMASRSPTDGARIVARAWVDPEFKARLVADTRSAVAELGYVLAPESQLAVMENTASVHHIVVCTLCSCYPTSLLGPPPDWYKSFAYRSRAVSDPRGVMREFGLELDESVEVRVVDSTADLRYVVLPERPAGTEDMSEEELAKLVNRDSMIGVTNASSPEVVSV